MCFHSSEDAQKALEHFRNTVDDKENNMDDPHSAEYKRMIVCEFKTKKQRAIELEKSTF